MPDLRAGAYPIDAKEAQAASLGLLVAADASGIGAAMVPERIS